MELLTEGDKKIEFLGQGENCAGLSVGGRGCNRGLFNAAVMEGASSATERDVVSGVAFTADGGDRRRRLRSIGVAQRMLICEGCG